MLRLESDFTFYFNISVISFGPYLTRRGKPESLRSAISYTGFVLEFASENCSGTVPLYFIKDDDGAFEDLSFLEKDLICDVQLFRRAFAEPMAGRPHPLQHLLAALYLNHKPATPLTEFVTAIREHIPLKTGYNKRRPGFGGLLKEEFAEAGFELIDLWQYGRSLQVSFGWIFPQDRPNPRSRLCLYGGAFVCTPTPDRTLGKGKWMMPLNVIVGYLFATMLKKMCHGKNPVEMLTDQGKEIALETFKWTQVSLLTPKELKNARIEFVRQHRSLHQSPKELAKAMMNEGLYSDTVEVYAITKQLPRLIEAAKDKKP